MKMKLARGRPVPCCQPGPRRPATQPHLQQRQSAPGAAARREFAFDGLPLAEELHRRRLEAHCGLAIVDLATGRIDQWLRLDGAVRELYDVAVLPGVVRPMVLGFVTPEIRQVLSMDTG